MSAHTPADADARTKDILSHFFGMFPALKKQGRLVITSASAVESVRAGRVRGETTPSSICYGINNPTMYTLKFARTYTSGGPNFLPC